MNMIPTRAPSPACTCNTRCRKAVNEGPLTETPPPSRGIDPAGSYNSASCPARRCHRSIAKDLGRPQGADGVYKFPGAETGLIPDVGYHRADHLPLVTDEDRPIPFAPDLAVEVASPSQDSEDMAAKARLYLKSG